MTLTPDQIDTMLREASELEKGSYNECVRDVCCHVKALAAEIQRLKSALREILDAKIKPGLYHGGETYYGLNQRIKSIAESTLATEQPKCN